MPEEGKARMTVWVEPKDREDMKLIAESAGLGSDSAAIRFAVRSMAKQIRDDESRAARRAR